VTGIVVIIMIVLVTALAYVTEAVPLPRVVAGAAPPAALIVILPIIGRMCGTAAAAAADAAAVYDSEHSTARVGSIR